jgi:archaemetzincin
MRAAWWRRNVWSALSSALLACGAADAAGTAVREAPDPGGSVPSQPVPKDSAVARPAEPQIRAVVLLAVLKDPRPGAEGFPAALVDEVEAALRRVYQVEVRRLPIEPLPREAYYAPRRRYRADRLLEHLGTRVPGDLPAGTRVLGLTTADISTTKEPHKDWGVFGLGEVGGTAAMVSSHRLRRKARDAEQVRWRVTNTAVHELGHVLGLDHCVEPNCVMLDAEGGIANTDASSGGPGPQCLAKLERAAPLRPASELGAGRRADAP